MIIHENNLSSLHLLIYKTLRTLRYYKSKTHIDMEQPLLLQRIFIKSQAR